MHRHISACSTPPPRSSIHRPGAGSLPLRCAWPGVYLTPSHTDLSEQWPRDEHRRGWPLNVLWSVPRRLRQLLPATTGRHAHAKVVDGKRQATILPQGALVTEAGARGLAGAGRSDHSPLSLWRRMGRSCRTIWHTSLFSCCTSSSRGQISKALQRSFHARRALSIVEYLHRDCTLRSGGENRGEKT